MNCHRVTSLISAYVDGELAGVEMLEIRRHLSGCADCAQEYEELRMMKLAIARLGSVAPREDFAASLMMRLDDVYVSPHHRVFNSMVRFLHEKLSPVAAALAASGLALVLLSAGGVENVSPVENNVVASLPYEARIHNMSVPGSPVAIPNSEPLKVANSSSNVGGATFELASLSYK